jgi:hypothetical protein
MIEHGENEGRGLLGYFVVIDGDEMDRVRVEEARVLVGRQIRMIVAVFPNRPRYNTS